MRMQMGAREADEAIAAAARKLEREGVKDDSTEELLRETLRSLPTSGITKTIQRVAASEVPSLSALPEASMSFDPRPQPGEVWDVNDAGIVYGVRVEGVEGDMVAARVLGPNVLQWIPRFFFVRRVQGAEDVPF